MLKGESLEKLQHGIQDVEKSEKESEWSGLKLAKGEGLERVIDVVNDLATRMESDEPIKAGDVLKLDEFLQGTRIDFYGQKLTLKEVKKILKDNEIMYQEIREGNFSNIDKLTYITPEVAERLSKYQGDLGFNVTFLSDEAARYFGEHRFGALTFSNLTSLSDQAARYLSKHQGSLWLPSLSSLSDQGVEYFAESSWYTLTSISVKDRINKIIVINKKKAKNKLKNN